MFVRVSRLEHGLHFTVVDIQQRSKNKELDQILDLGVIAHGDLTGEQAWVVIAENLIASPLEDSEKRLLARDLANWLPPLSRKSLLQTRQQDLQQLADIYRERSAEVPTFPVKLSEKDPLTIIADWLADD